MFNLGNQAEFTFVKSGVDYYDISILNGYNIPMEFAPLEPYANVCAFNIRIFCAYLLFLDITCVCYFVRMTYMPHMDPCSRQILISVAILEEEKAALDTVVALGSSTHQATSLIGSKVGRGDIPAVKSSVLNNA